MNIMLLFLLSDKEGLFNLHQTVSLVFILLSMLHMVYDELVNWGLFGEL